MKFRDLKIGEHFKFESGIWNKTAKKTTSRCYVWANKKAIVKGKGRQAYIAASRAGLLGSCVGSLNVGVKPTGRSSPVKRRKGRGRGSATYGRK